MSTHISNPTPSNEATSLEETIAKLIAAIDMDDRFPILDYLAYEPEPVGSVDNSNESLQTVFFVAGWPDTHSVFRDNIIQSLLKNGRANGHKRFRVIGISLPGYEQPRNTSSLAKADKDSGMPHVRDVAPPFFGYQLSDVARMLGKTFRHLLTDDNCGHVRATKRPILVCHDWGSVVSHEFLAQIEDGTTGRESFFDRIVALDVGGNFFVGESIFSLPTLKNVLFIVSYQWFLVLTSLFLPSGHTHDGYAATHRNAHLRHPRKGVVTFVTPSTDDSVADRTTAKPNGPKPSPLAATVGKGTPHSLDNRLSRAVLSVLPAWIPRELAACVTYTLPVTHSQVLIPSIVTSSFLHTCFATALGRPTYADSDSGETVLPNWRMFYPYVWTYVAAILGSKERKRKVGFGPISRFGVERLICQRRIRPLSSPTFFVYGSGDLRFFSMAWLRALEKRSAVDAESGSKVVSKSRSTDLGHWAFAHTNSKEGSNIVSEIVEFICA